jgi:hypothetical protein
MQYKLLNTVDEAPLQLIVSVYQTPALSFICIKYDVIARPFELGCVQLIFTPPVVESTVVETKAT